MAGISNQGHGIAGEAEDHLNDHEGRVETDANCKGCSEAHWGMKVSARAVSVALVIVMGVNVMVLMRMGHGIS